MVGFNFALFWLTSAAGLFLFPIFCCILLPNEGVLLTLVLFFVVVWLLDVLVRCSYKASSHFDACLSSLHRLFSSSVTMVVMWHYSFTFAGSLTFFADADMPLSFANLTLLVELQITIACFLFAVKVDGISALIAAGFAGFC